MKLKHIFIMSVALCTLSACSLEEDSSSFATSANFYKNAQQCRAALNTCYSDEEHVFLQDDACH